MALKVKGRIPQILSPLRQPVTLQEETEKVGCISSKELQERVGIEKRRTAVTLGLSLNYLSPLLTGSR